MTTVAACQDAVSFDEKVAFLATLPGVVQVIETHMAYVFLTAEFAFKLKKPISCSYFDHRSPAARASACNEELRLNRALAGDVYLGSVPLVLTKTGLGIGGDGTIVDSLVQMRRLPAEQTTDTLICDPTGGRPPSSGPG